MPTDLKPSTWLGDGYDAAANQIKLNTADAGSPLLLELSDAKADPDTGDIRNVAHALVEALWAAWEAQPAENRPRKLIISRSSTTNRSDGSLLYVYTFKVTRVPPSGDYSIPSEA